MLTAVPLFFDIFTYCVCLFCARIGDTIMEFDATVIQERGLASYKTRFNPPFSTFENACTKSGIWQFLSIRFVIWFCYVIMDFPNWFSSEFSLFVVLLFTRKMPSGIIDKRLLTKELHPQERYPAGWSIIDSGWRNCIYWNDILWEDR